MAIQLPNETLAAIFDNLPPSALTVVACASYRFRLVAERILYTSVAIQESLPRDTPTPRHTHGCASTLLARPHLAEVVRKFSIRWQTDLGPRDEYLPAVAPALHALNAALRTLFALEQLDLALGLAGTPLDAHAVLDGCTFPALRVFALSGVGRGALSPKLYRGASASVSLANFLAHTPSIEALHLLDSYEPLALPAEALPALQVFRGSAIAAGCVLPARPVRLLGLVGHEFITERDLERIARSRSRIRWLDLSLMSVTPLLLRDISRHLGGTVEVLRVKLALRHTLHFALSGIVSAPPLSSTIHSCAVCVPSLPSPLPLWCLLPFPVPLPLPTLEPPCGPLARTRRVPRPAPARPLPDLRRRRRARQRARGERALHDLGPRVPRPPPRRLPQQSRVAARPARCGLGGRGWRGMDRRSRRGRDGMDQALGFFSECGGRVLSLNWLGPFAAPVSTFCDNGRDDDNDDEEARRRWGEFTAMGQVVEK